MCICHCRLPVGRCGPGSCQARTIEALSRGGPGTGPGHGPRFKSGTGTPRTGRAGHWAGNLNLKSGIIRVIGPGLCRPPPGPSPPNRGLAGAPRGRVGPWGPDCWRCQDTPRRWCRIRGSSCPTSRDRSDCSCWQSGVSSLVRAECQFTGVSLNTGSQNKLCGPGKRFLLNAV